MSRLLVVDDEPAIRRFLRIALQAAGHEVEEVATGQEALRCVTAHRPEVMLLDLGLPDIDGLDVIAAVRAFHRLPIIVLSARAEETDKVAALDAGADDYLQKPFGTGELLARLRAVLRRQPGDPPAAALSGAGVRLDVPAHRAWVGDAELHLTPREFALLERLMRDGGRVLTHRQLLTDVWGAVHVEDVQYLRVYVGQLREKLRAAAAGLGVDPAAALVNEPGIGYRWQADPGRPG